MENYLATLPAWPFYVVLVAVLAVVWMCEASPVREDFDGGNDEWLKGAKQ